MIKQKPQTNGIEIDLTGPQGNAYSLMGTAKRIGKQIKTAKIGIVWHTTYSGSALQDMKASFGASISKLTKSRNVWMDDATYKDVSGKATMTASETATVTKSLSSAGSTFQKINSANLTKFLNLQNSMTGALAGASLKTYNNSKVRQGQKISNPSQHARGYEKWVEMSIQKQIDKAKSVKGKEKYTNIQTEYVREVKKQII